MYSIKREWLALGISVLSWMGIAPTAVACPAKVYPFEVKQDENPVIRGNMSTYMLSFGEAQVVAKVDQISGSATYQLRKKDGSQEVELQEEAITPLWGSFMVVRRGDKIEVFHKGFPLPSTQKARRILEYQVEGGWSDLGRFSKNPTELHASLVLYRGDRGAEVEAGRIVSKSKIGARAPATTMDVSTLESGALKCVAEEAPKGFGVNSCGYAGCWYRDSEGLYHGPGGVVAKLNRATGQLELPQGNGGVSGIAPGPGTGADPGK